MLPLIRSLQVPAEPNLFYEKIHSSHEMNASYYDRHWKSDECYRLYWRQGTTETSARMYIWYTLCGRKVVLNIGNAGSSRLNSWKSVLWCLGKLKESYKQYKKFEESYNIIIFLVGFYNGTMKQEKVVTRLKKEKEVEVIYSSRISLDRNKPSACFCLKIKYLRCSFLC